MHLEKATPKNEDLIYDVGMHEGEDTHYYLKRGFRVIAFEADPKLVKYCRSKFSEAIEKKHLTIVEGAIVDRDLEDGQRTVKFYKNNSVTSWGTVSDDWAQRNELLGTHNDVI